MVARGLWAVARRVLTGTSERVHPEVLYSGLGSLHQCTALGFRLLFLMFDGENLYVLIIIKKNEEHSLNKLHTFKCQNNKVPTFTCCK